MIKKLSCCKTAEILEMEGVGHRRAKTKAELLRNTVKVCNVPNRLCQLLSPEY